MIRGAASIRFWVVALQSKTCEQSRNQSLVLVSGWLERPGSEVED